MLRAITFWMHDSYLGLLIPQMIGLCCFCMHWNFVYGVECFLLLETVLQSRNWGRGVKILLHSFWFWLAVASVPVLWDSYLVCFCFSGNLVTLAAAATSSFDGTPVVAVLVSLFHNSFIWLLHILVALPSPVYKLIKHYLAFNENKSRLLSEWCQERKRRNTGTWTTNTST